MPSASRKPSSPRPASTRRATPARNGRDPLPGVPKTFPAAVAALPKPATARERILFAATSVLNEEGYGALTQARVAARAGVRQSHVTYYFPARVDLLLETAAYSCDAMLGAMGQAVDSGALTLENFRGILIADVSDRRIARLMCGLIASSDEDPRIKRWLAGFEESNRQRLRAILRKLGLQASLAQVEHFHATYVGALLLDMGEATPESLARSERVVQGAFARLVAECPEPGPRAAKPKARSKSTAGKRP